MNPLKLRLVHILQNSDFLARKVSHLDYASFRQQDPLALATLLSGVPSIADAGVPRRIVEEDVDGEAFLMLTQKVRTRCCCRITSGGNSRAGGIGLGRLKAGEPNLEEPR